MPQTRPKDWNQPRDLLTLQVTREPPVVAGGHPANASAHSAARHRARDNPANASSFSQGLINNQHFDMARVDFTAKLGATEIWKVENLVGMDHPFHLHGFQFQVIERNGKPEPYRSWKDAVNVRRQETVRLDRPV